MRLRSCLPFVIGILLAFITLPYAAATAPSGGLSSDEMTTARIRIAQKKPLEAIPLLQKCLKANARDAEATNLVGVAYLQAGSPGAAMAYFRAALRLEPGNIRFLNNMASSYHIRKDHRAAIRYYKKALEKNPDYVLALGNLANVYFAQKKSLQAVDILHRLVRIDPDYLVRQQESVPVGVDDIVPAERHFFLAKLYLQAGDLDRALHFLRMSLDEGLRNRKRLTTDKDFEPLWNDPRFKNMLEGRS